MFLRRYRRTKAGKEHVYFALVETVRTASGPRQHIVAYLGELQADAERRWQRTVAFHNGLGDERQLQLFVDDAGELPDDPDVVRIRLEDVGWTNGRAFGDVFLGLWLWRKLKLDGIVDRHLPVGKHTVRPADVVAIEVINRLCAPCSEFALAEHWYGSTGLEDLLGVPDQEVTKDRLYRTLDLLVAAKEPIEDDLRRELAGLFDLDFDLLLYDLTSSYFEGLCEENDLAQRGYSRDHRGDCKQIVLALVVTRDGFPLAHETLRGNIQDAQTLQTIVANVERRFGKSQRIWVMDRGFANKDNLRFLAREQRRYLIGAKRAELKRFEAELHAAAGWQNLRDTVEVKLLRRGKRAYVLARSLPRRRKERAMRKRQLLGLYAALVKLRKRLAKPRARRQKPSKTQTNEAVWQQLGRLRERFPKAARFVAFVVDAAGKLTWQWRLDELRRALARDGAYLLQSNQSTMTAAEFWECYMQLTAAEAAFRTLKSELLIRPIWHQYAQRTQAHVMICFLAYALWRTLQELSRQAGLETFVRKLPEPPAEPPPPRPMSPANILRELGRIQIGDIQLRTTAGQLLCLRRVARPMPEQARILAALKLELPERLQPDRILS